MATIKPKKKPPGKAKKPPGNKPRPPGAKPIKSAGNSSAQAAHKLAVFKAAYKLNGGNATQAAIEAGYSKKTAHQAGYRLLKSIEHEIAEEQAATIQKMGLTLERTLQEIARLAYADPRKLYNADGTPKSVHELDDDTAAVIAGIEVDVTQIGDAITSRVHKLKTHDKKGALDMAMKYHGAYEQDNKQRSQTVHFHLTDTDEAL